MFKRTTITARGKVKPLCNLSLTKRTLVEWISGNWTQRDGIALDEGLCDLGGIISTGLRDWGEEGRALFSVIPWHVPCNRKKHGKHQSG
jgi:hypothetical protein